MSGCTTRSPFYVRADPFHRPIGLTFSFYHRGPGDISSEVVVLVYIRSIHQGTACLLALFARFISPRAGLPRVRPMFHPRLAFARSCSFCFTSPTSQPETRLKPKFALFSPPRLLTPWYVLARDPASLACDFFRPIPSFSVFPWGSLIVVSSATG